MNATEKKMENTAIVSVLVIIIAVIINNSKISNSQILMPIFTLFAIVLVFAVLISVSTTCYFSFKYMLILIDTYIDEMFSGKLFKKSDTFYCQVCKSKVETDDVYCSACGMTL